jgi:hypothetical protein
LDGTGKQTILDKEVWTAYRTDYNLLSLQTADGWSTYNLTTGKLETVAGPSAYLSRGYVDNSSAGRSLWVDTNGGHNTLNAYDLAAAKDEPIYSHSGLTYPLYWLTKNVVVYRLVTGSEIADYVVGTAGDQSPHKIADVVNTYGFSVAQ